jgi:hypothetical protein
VSEWVGEKVKCCALVVQPSANRQLIAIYYMSVLLDGQRLLVMCMCWCLTAGRSIN